ncbi:S-layer homology domain-containing protein [Cohnella cellulosilytica]|uniref:S-layer homology domain-containing protein n=1 Tax=Cohnella cellulosilytica TaxID=986710 RepID=A0ABW2FH22_9BACL
MSKRFATYIIALLVLSLAATTPTNAKQADRFSDVPAAHWASKAIDWGIEQEVLDISPQAAFNPEESITEAEFLKMLISAYVSLPDQGKNWYDKYYAYANEKKWFVEGLSDQATVDQPLLRKNAAIILSSALGGRYQDDKKEAVTTAVNDLYATGISNGKSSRAVEGFMINEYLTRAEAIQFVYQFVNQSGLSMLQGASVEEEWAQYEQVTFKDREGILAKHELFAKEHGLQIQSYESEGTIFIQLIGEEGQSNSDAGSPVHFTSSYRMDPDGTLTWNLITNDTVADPSDAYELLAAMFSYDSNFSDPIRQDLAVFAQEIGYRKDWQLSVSYGKLDLSTNYNKETNQYYIVSILTA